MAEPYLDHARGPQQPDEGRSVRVDYLCLGHPAWPGNLQVPTPERAQAWLDEHETTHPGVFVVKRTTIRENFPAAPSAQPGYGTESGPSGQRSEPVHNPPIPPSAQPDVMPCPRCASPLLGRCLRETCPQTAQPVRDTEEGRR